MFAKVSTLALLALVVSVSRAQAQGLDGPALGQAVRQARILALEAPSV
mgnify:CR=1 FL=1